MRINKIFIFNVLFEKTHNIHMQNLQLNNLEHI